MLKEKLLEILEDAHNKCEGNGYLKNLTFEELERMNETFTIMCDYCPPNSYGTDGRCRREICTATEEVLYHYYCYDCNKCGKWSFDEDEVQECYNRQIEEEYGY